MVLLDPATAAETQKRSGQIYLERRIRALTLDYFAYGGEGAGLVMRVIFLMSVWPLRALIARFCKLVLSSPL